MSKNKGRSEIVSIAKSDFKIEKDCCGLSAMVMSRKLAPDWGDVKNIIKNAGAHYIEFVDEKSK